MTVYSDENDGIPKNNEPNAVYTTCNKLTLFLKAMMKEPNHVYHICNKLIIAKHPPMAKHNTSM